MEPQLSICKHHLMEASKPSNNKHRITKKAPSKAKSRPTTKTKMESDNRVLTDVLLAIKAVHLASIVSKQKNHEYRKCRLQDGVERLWFYETADQGGKASITYGYPNLEPYELMQPVTLEEMKSKWAMGAPMGWRYVESDLWQDRRGENGDRDEKVKKVF
ncbi:hypothetical protein F5B20DRAFT_579848 [Whalleya microplaca]|nr:hypothetical protein F5B20DRAFT_579848 [Whalleya microplaca]